MSGYIRATTARAAVGEVADPVARQQHVVRRDAGLPGIDQLAEHDPLHRPGRNRRRADDRRRLAAQFQRHRREVGRGGTHHVMADGGGAGEQQVVERQRRKRLGDLGVAGDHADLVGVEMRVHQLGEQRREARRVLAHLDHCAVAGGQGVDQRADGQEQRVVPRHDDADHAQRLRPQFGPRRQKQQVGQAPARLHPAPALGAARGGSPTGWERSPAGRFPRAGGSRNRC